MKFPAPLREGVRGLGVKRKNRDEIGAGVSAERAVRPPELGWLRDLSCQFSSLKFPEACFHTFPKA